MRKEITRKGWSMYTPANKICHGNNDKENLSTYANANESVHDTCPEKNLLEPSGDDFIRKKLSNKVSGYIKTKRKTIKEI